MEKITLMRFHPRKLFITTPQGKRIPVPLAATALKCGALTKEDVLRPYEDAIHAFIASDGKIEDLYS